MRKWSAATVECPLDRFTERLAFKRELPSKKPEVVEVLHPAVSDSQHHNGLVFLGDDSFSRISEQSWRWLLEQCRVHYFNRSGNDGISKADVDLQRNPGFPQASVNTKAYPLVLVRLFDWLGTDCVGQEYQPVFFHGGRADFAKAIGTPL